MKSIAIAVLVATLSAAGGAFAQTSVSDNGPMLASEFPGVVTYADQHRNDGIAQADKVFPASVSANGPLLASEFPGVVTYADQHRNDGIVQANNVFPASVDDNGPMLASEFPHQQSHDGTTYAGIAQPSQN